MTWHIYLILGVCGAASLLALYVVFRKTPALTEGQVREVVKAHERESADLRAAEKEEEQELEENAKRAETDLRALAKREQEAGEPWVGQTDEQIEAEANKALERWNQESKLNSPLPVGVYLAMVMWWWLFYATIACADPTSQPAKLTTTQKLIQALNQCTFSQKRQAILHKQAIKNLEARCTRKVKQREAKIRALRREMLVYRQRPPGNTGLIVGVSVAGVIAVGAVVVALVAVFIPETFGNKRGTS